MTPLLKAVIADDEPAAVNVISSLLKQLAPGIVLAGVARDGLETIRLLTGLRPELVFMDIDMPVMNGIRIVEQLADPDLQVIFTTGSADYALRALKLHAADYLLKPIDPAEFAVAVARACGRVAMRSTRDAGAVRLQLPTQNEIVYLDEEDISHVIGMGSYCQIHTLKGDKIMVSKNIGHIEQKLSAGRFFRCHNSHIVNLAFVAKYLHRDGFFVEMKSGTVLEVSRRSREGLLEALAGYSR